MPKLQAPLFRDPVHDGDVNPVAAYNVDAGEHFIDARGAEKRIAGIEGPLGGSSPAGDRLGLTNYYLEYNGKPIFAISGEFHYSRCDETFWDDELAKMRMGGIDIVSTYVFWNHHEELRGRFRWDGNRNLRRFVELCGKRELRVIVRVGPWCHGEARNGGFPDWLYGKPFDLRSNDPEYLCLAGKLYSEIGAQLRGLLFKDGGPVIGVQLENEYMHSAAPWEMTTGISDEWVAGGRDGDSHILKLKELAKAAGIDVPFYTCTAWGGAASPVPEVLPLWGGYSFQPWLFYGDVKEHPATPEYIFRDYHSNLLPATYNFAPRYSPEEYPYACCEMGGGMSVFYRYRFKLPPESVEAMAIVKTAGGCNFLGYYMFHGGTNPKGELTPFLNEHAVPKISYDYQAAIGEFGQEREHYTRLKALHLFLKDFAERICRTKTSLPSGAESIDPHDGKSLRWAVRTAGDSGFVFLCNYQDHSDMEAKADVRLRIALNRGELLIPRRGGFALGKNLSCVLPFNFDLDGINLRYATAQAMARLKTHEGILYAFFQPEGMEAEFCIDSFKYVDIRLTGATRGGTEESGGDGTIHIRQDTGKDCLIEFKRKEGTELRILSVTRENALKFHKISLRGDEYALLAGDAVLAGPGEENPGFRLEQSGGGFHEFLSYPPFPEEFSIRGGRLHSMTRESIFARYIVETPLSAVDFGFRKIGKRKAVLGFKQSDFKGAKRAILEIEYSGDIGNAYIGDELVADNFCNGEVWEIELTRLRERLMRDDLVLEVIPVRKGAKVVHDTSMAGRTETSETEEGGIGAIRMKAVREIEVRFPRLG